MKLNEKSKYVWRRPRNDDHRKYDFITGVFDKVFSRGLSNDGKKRELFENGTEGKALILSCPPPLRVSQRVESLGAFKVKVQVPGSDAYETKVRQSFWKDEWESMQPGSTVPCSVDPEDPKRVLLVAPEPSAG